mmetsp:Transcript_71625/g.207553  ORF Transcript_71625/g.207553 Transcript_71625/m.207553 type:complete len:201 (-) Transcript_71625:108-710(-)
MAHCRSDLRERLKHLASAEPALPLVHEIQKVAPGAKLQEKPDSAGAAAVLVDGIAVACDDVRVRLDAREDLRLTLRRGEAARDLNALLASDLLHRELAATPRLPHLHHRAEGALGQESDLRDLPAAALPRVLDAVRGADERRRCRQILLDRGFHRLGPFAEQVGALLEGRAGKSLRRGSCGGKLGLRLPEEVAPPSTEFR